MRPLLAILFVLFSGLVNAQVSPAQKLEIEHLLNFVKHSSCKINRNGQLHTASVAVSHINKKFLYFKDDIHTTEQFIELAATKSTMSGRLYMVECSNGKQIRTREWLLNELESYRESGSG